MNAMHEVDYKVFGEDLQYVEIELDPQEAVVAEAGEGPLRADRRPLVVIAHLLVAGEAASGQHDAPLRANADRLSLSLGDDSCDAPVLDEQLPHARVEPDGNARLV